VDFRHTLESPWRSVAEAQLPETAKVSSIVAYQPLDEPTVSGLRERLRAAGWEVLGPTERLWGKLTDNLTAGSRVKTLQMSPCVGIPTTRGLRPRE
jgi:hypothetical protein